MISHLLAQKCPKKDISKKGRPAINGNFEWVDRYSHYIVYGFNDWYIVSVHVICTVIYNLRAYNTLQCPHIQNYHL